jgi:hypothetical protein
MLPTRSAEADGVTPDHTLQTTPPEAALTPDFLRPRAPGDEDPVLALLKAGIPLTLLLDLAQEDPRSEEIYRAETSNA